MVVAPSFKKPGFLWVKECHNTEASTQPSHWAFNKSTLEDYSKIGLDKNFGWFVGLDLSTRLELCRNT